MWSVEENKVIPVNVEFEYKGNHGIRVNDITVYTALYTSNSNGKLYLSARKKTVRGGLFTAPVGALVLVNYEFGSRRYTYSRYKQWFVVEEGSKVEENTEDYELTATNLRKLENPTKEDIVHAEARIINAGLNPSTFVPIKSIVHLLGENAFSQNEVEKTEKKINSIARDITIKLLKHRPEVLEELGYNVEELRRHFLAISPREKPSRVKALLKKMESGRV